MLNIGARVHAPAPGLELQVLPSSGGRDQSGDLCAKDRIFEVSDYIPQLRQAVAANLRTVDPLACYQGQDCTVTDAAIFVAAAGVSPGLSTSPCLKAGHPVGGPSPKENHFPARGSGHLMHHKNFL